MKKYMLIAKQKEKPQAFQDAADRAAFMRRFNAWAEELSAKNQFIGADQLPKKYKTVEQRDEKFRVTDGPFAETKEFLTGYFLIRAQNLEEAANIAQACPVLRFDNLDIYEIGGNEQ